MKVNRLLSLITAFSLVFALAAPLSVRAAGAMTQTEAVDWAIAQVGEGWDIGSGSGAQCVDLILAYYREMGAPRPYGDAWQYWTNELPEDWVRIANTPTFVPEPGDIAVWNRDRNAGGWGHVAIIISATVHSMDVVAQNTHGAPYPKGGKVGSRDTETYNNFYGVIRPRFAEANVDQPPAAATGLLQYTVTTPGGVKVREFASTDALAVGALAVGSTFTIDASAANNGFTWGHIQSVQSAATGSYGGTADAWVALDFCEQILPAFSPAPTPMVTPIIDPFVGLEDNVDTPQPTPTAEPTPKPTPKPTKITLNAGKGNLEGNKKMILYKTPKKKIGALPQPTRLGYKFTGWVRANDTKVKSYSKVPSEKVVYRATWKKKKKRK